MSRSYAVAPSERTEAQWQRCCFSTTRKARPKGSRLSQTSGAVAAKPYTRPNLFDGLTFASLEEGMAYASQIGFPEEINRARRTGSERARQ
jgi:hypothetical protein